MNTEFRYTLFDEGLYRVEGSFIIEGQFSFDELKLIQLSLEEGRFFMPEKIGLSSLMEPGLTAFSASESMLGEKEDIELYDKSMYSYAWHELILSKPSFSTEKPLISKSSFLDLILRNKGRWHSE